MKSRKSPGNFIFELLNPATVCYLHFRDFSKIIVPTILSSALQWRLVQSDNLLFCHLKPIKRTILEEDQSASPRIDYFKWARIETKYNISTLHELSLILRLCWIIKRVQRIYHWDRRNPAFFKEIPRNSHEFWEIQQNVCTDATYTCLPALSPWYLAETRWFYPRFFNNSFLAIGVCLSSKNDIFMALYYYSASVWPMVACPGALNDRSLRFRSDPTAEREWLGGLRPLQRGVAYFQGGQLVSRRKTSADFGRRHRGSFLTTHAFFSPSVSYVYAYR